jgi:hypothetical protein
MTNKTGVADNGDAVDIEFSSGDYLHILIKNKTFNPKKVKQCFD